MFIVSKALLISSATVIVRAGGAIWLNPLARVLFNVCHWRVSFCIPVVCICDSISVNFFSNFITITIIYLITIIITLITIIISTLIITMTLITIIITRITIIYSYYYNY